MHRAFSLSPRPGEIKSWLTRHRGIAVLMTPESGGLIQSLIPPPYPWSQEVWLDELDRSQKLFLTCEVNLKHSLKFEADLACQDTVRR